MLYVFINTYVLRTYYREIEIFNCLKQSSNLNESGYIVGNKIHTHAKILRKKCVKVAPHFMQSRRILKDVIERCFFIVGCVIKRNKAIGKEFVKKYSLQGT